MESKNSYKLLTIYIYACVDWLEMKATKTTTEQLINFCVWFNQNGDNIELFFLLLFSLSAYNKWFLV